MFVTGMLLCEVFCRNGGVDRIGNLVLLARPTEAGSGDGGSTTSGAGGPPAPSFLAWWSPVIDR